MPLANLYSLKYRDSYSQTESQKTIDELNRDNQALHRENARLLEHNRQLENALTVAKIEAEYYESEVRAYKNEITAIIFCFLGIAVLISIAILFKI